MENSNTDPQMQEPPATEPTEPMVEAAARAIRVSIENSGHNFSDAAAEAVYHDAARAALIAGIAAALEKGR